MQLVRVLFFSLVTISVPFLCAQEPAVPVAVKPQAAPPAEQEPTANAEQLMPTVAEYSKYTATATEPQVAAYMRQLANIWQESELTTIGQTTEGRPIWALVVSPKKLGETKPITALLLGGIHSGECDGKEALLALARDMATGGQGDWWHSLRLIFVPNFNADGNERRGTGHRPGQAGPAQGMGIRENAQGLDLNRDFVKLETPEVRSLVAALNEYDVDVLIDTHTTNGSLHQFQLTYDIPHNPISPKPLDDWLRTKLIPQATQRLAADGFKTFYYGNFDSAHRRWTTYGHQPRYSTEYMGLRGRIGILSESYSYASYETRVRVSYAFVREVLRGVAEDEALIRHMIDQNEPDIGVATTTANANALVAPAMTGQPAQQDQPIARQIPVRAELAKTADGVSIPGFQTDDGNPPRGPYSAESLTAHQPKDYSVQFWNRAAATKQVALPSHYVVPAQYAWAVSRLIRHGVRVHRLTVDTPAKVERYRVSELDKSPAFQEHEMIRLTTTVEDSEQTLTAGSYVVNTHQLLGNLAAYLLEPESEDSLATWNFFDPDLDVGELYPVIRVTAPLAADVLEPIGSVSPSETITLDRLMQPGKSVDYSGGSVRGANWLKGSSEYVIGNGRRTYAVDAATGSRRRLDELDVLRGKLETLEAFSADEARRAATIDSFTEDWAFALVEHKNDLYFFDSKSEAIRQLTHSPEEREQLAELSPDGTRVAYVHGNNLYVVDCESTEVKKLTHDGSEETLNAILDWVYQEELYGRGNFKAFWWSPDSSRIAFLRLDQTPVPHYQVSDSISFGQSLESTRYPKAGEPLPHVGVWLATLESGALKEVDLSSFPADDRLVARVSWSPTNELWLQVFNRVQNQQNLVRVDPTNGVSRVLFTEVSPGWIEVRGTPEFLPDGDFLWISDLPDGRTHLYRVAVESGSRTQLTQGDWDIDSLVSISNDGVTAYVSGNIAHPTELQLLSVNLQNGAITQLTGAPGTHRAKVDATSSFFIDVFSSTDSKPFASLHSIDGELLRVIEAPISDRNEFLNLSPPKTFTVTARDGMELQAQLLLPPGFDAEEPDRKLPVLFYVYGGPQAPTVRNAWAGRNYWWHQMLCQQGFAVMLCDNRASRGRGVKDTWTIRGDMCRVELQDLEDAVNWVNQQPWADPDRIGIWGWSYGGYFTSYALTHCKLFKCGIAGAPVTDWRNYDAIYTERYMDLPDANQSGYISSSSVEAAANLHGRLMIIHGERDDNVHISNTLQLAHALQQAGKQFDLMVYPKNRHGIVNPAQRYHMYQMMTDFLHRHLGTSEE